MEMKSASPKHDLLRCETANGSNKRVKRDISKDQRNELICTNLFKEENSNDFQPPRKVDIAWEFVESVLDRHTKISSSPRAIRGIEPIASDDLYDITAQMIQCQDEFLQIGSPVEVTLAYHYTHERHISSISKNGLISGHREGTFGRGIYLGYNACAFHSRGPIGLIVAILKGRCEYVDRSTRRENHNDRIQNANTFIGNKKANFTDKGPCPNYHDEIVLQETHQCVPIIKFDGSLVDKHGNTDEKGNDTLWIYHREIQRVVDLYFNSGVSFSNKITKSDVFPNIDRTYSTLLSIPFRHETFHIFPTHDESQIRQQWSSYHNLPRHFFDEEARDDAVAYLLLYSSITVASALEYAGFVDFEVKDIILSRNVMDILTKLKKKAMVWKFSQDSLVHRAACNLMNYSFSGSTGIIREVMSSAGFLKYEIELIERRHQILVELITLQTKTTDRHDCVGGDYSLLLSSHLSHKEFNDHQGQYCRHGTLPYTLESVVKTDLSEDVCAGQNITALKAHQQVTSTFQSLNSRLDHVAKYLAINDIVSHQSTIENLLKQSFTPEESEDSRYQIYVMIKADVFRRILHHGRESMETRTQSDQKDLMIFQNTFGPVSATTPLNCPSQNVACQSTRKWNAGTLI